MPAHDLVGRRGAGCGADPWDAGQRRQLVADRARAGGSRVPGGVGGPARSRPIIAGSLGDDRAGGTAVVGSVPVPLLAVGHSLGGTVLAAAAAQWPSACLVYVDAPFTASRTGWSREQLRDHYSTAKASRNASLLRERRPDWSDHDIEVEVAAGKAFDVGTAVSVSLTFAGRDLTGHAVAAAQRSLLILADGDASAVPAATVEAMRSAGAGVVTVPGADHAVWCGHESEFLALLQARLRMGPGG